MKHKAKSFIAVLLALCLMMSLGVGALAVDGSDGGDTPGGDGPVGGGDSGGGNTPGGDSPEPSEGGKEDDSAPGGDDPGDPPEPRVGGEYNINIAEGIVGGKVEVMLVVDPSSHSTDYNTTVANEGDWVTFSVTADTDYELVGKPKVISDKDSSEVTVNDTYASGQYNFKMPASNVTISAEFKSTDDEGGGEVTGNTYDIRIGTGIKNGTVTSDKTEAAAGEPVTLTVTPVDGYVLKYLNIVKLSGGSKLDYEVEGDKYTFIMPGEMVMVGATFAKLYNITVNKAEGGTVTSPVAQSVANELISLNVSVKEGYSLEQLIVTPTEGEPETYDATSSHAVFRMPASNVTITPVFVKEYKIGVSMTPGGSVTCRTTAQEGNVVTFTVTPHAGYEMDGAPSITGLNGDYSITADGKYSFSMPANDVMINVTFKQVAYAITVTQPAHGKVSTEPEAMAAAGTPVTLTAVPDEGYELVGYTVTKDGGGAVTVTNGQFVMPNSAVTVSATFKLKQDQPDWSHWHKIDTWSNSVDGGISVGEDADMAKAGSTVTFRVWHNYRYDYYDYDVYVLNDRTGNRVSLDYSAYYDEYSFTMPDDDVTIYVYFDYAGRYSITKDVEGDGSIYVRSSADHGDTVWIEAAPSAGQSLTSLRVFYGEPWAYGDKGYYGYWDEAEVKYSTYWDAYYFTMPADDVVVYARFTDGATVDVITGDHGDAKVSSRYADKGDWVYITAYPDEGYEVDSVTVTDSLGRSVKVTELSYDYFLFTMPGTNVDVKVTFRVKDYDVFYDVSRGDWYYKAVRFVHEKGIMEGTGTHYFSPEADLSRGMLATILYRLEGSPAVSGYSGFADVADTAYYAKAVAWAKANGIVNGVTATAYEPDTAVTREELAAILCRYAAFKGKDTAISYDYLAGFSDANTSHVYARPALNWAVAYDIINGQGNGVLAPRATATRAEVAQVLMNYLEVFD